MATFVLAGADVRLVVKYLQWEQLGMIATHQSPVERPSPSFMIRAAVDDVEGGDNFEQLWTRQVDVNLFELCCIPFFAYDLALGDVVRAEASSGFLVEEVVRRSGNGVVRIAVKRRDDVDEVHAQLHELLGRLEYLCEWYAPGYVAVSIETGPTHDEFFDALAAIGDAIEVERFLC